MLSHGTAVTSVTALTESTDYSIDLDKGKITILSVANIGTDNVYAEYNYSSIEGQPGVKDSMVSRLIDTTTSMIDDMTFRTWQTLAQVVREEHIGRGYFQRQYTPSNLPPKIWKDLLEANLTDSATSVTVNDTTDLTVGDYISIETEVLIVSSIDTSTTITVTRGALGSTAAAHSGNIPLINLIVEQSNSPAGSAPSFTIISYQSQYEVTSLGMITLLHNDITSDGVLINNFPPLSFPNRVRLTYTNGASSVDPEINQACITAVTNLLGSSAIAKGIAQGVDGFTPRANDVLRADLKMLLKGKIRLKADGF